MNIIINGDKYENLPKGMSLANLLVHLNVPEGKIAVERNLEIVSKSAYATTLLCEGDELEIIHFIGGG